MNAIRALPLVISLAALLPAAAPPRVDPRVIPGDAHDLVLMHPARPYRLRLHLQVDRRGFLANWQEQVAALFAHLDVDDNGGLSEAEARALPHRMQWWQLLRGESIEPAAHPAFADLAMGKPELRLADLLAHYDDSSAGSLQVRWGWQAVGDDPLSARLWGVLDRNGDGKLSKAELASAARRLEVVDRNEDERIVPNELIEGRGGSVQRGSGRGRAHDTSRGGTPFLTVRPDRPIEPLVPALLTRYDRDRDGRLKPDEFAIAPHHFRWLDHDGDGRLDRSELAGWFGLAPDASLLVPLENAPRRAVALVEQSASHFGAHLTRDGMWLITGDHALEVRRVNGQTAPARMGSGGAFVDLDADNDGHLSSREVQRPPFTFVAWLRLADRDQDGRLSRKEFDAFAALRFKLTNGTTHLSIDSEGRSLYRLLDANGDGVLAFREWRTTERFAPWLDRGGDLTKERLPHQFRITASLGQPLPDPGAAPQLGRRSVGPVWFARMDRNGDGDLSPKEWLGTREQFRAIDTDGDGLISVDEAEAVDRKTRER